MPVDHRRPHEFEVSKVPTLTQCIRELGEGQVMKLGKEDGDVDVPKCLLPYLEYFKSFLKQCEQKTINELKKKNKER